MTKIFLAGTGGHSYIYESNNVPYVLESFYYINEYITKLIPTFKMFLLDSGAYTFSQNEKTYTKKDYDEYLENYIKFINKNNVKYFFELDIDDVVGLKQTNKYREILEKKTGRKCIPVWNIWRGIDNYKELCKNYNYIAIGRIKRSGLSGDTKTLKTLLKIAEHFNTKVHLLGFTPSDINQFPCYSCDSTSWVTGGRYGKVYSYTNQKLKTVNRPEGYKLKINYKQINLHNLKEWLKFIKDADKNYKGVRINEI